MEVLTKPISIIYQHLVKWRGPISLEARQYDTHLQEGSERGFTQLQACQPDLGTGEGHGAEHLECQHRTHVGHHGIRSSPFQFMKGSAAQPI